MSRELIDHSDDLGRLEAEGYKLRIVDDAYLVIDGVEYVTPAGKEGVGQLMMPLTLQGNTTVKPDTHVAYWEGERPHRAGGGPLEALLMPDASPQDAGPSFPAVFMFSAKSDYRDYHHKVSTYVELLNREARMLREAEIEPTYG